MQSTRKFVQDFTTCYALLTPNALLVKKNDGLVKKITHDLTCLLLALLELAPAQFKMFIDSIVWGFKHTMRDIADISLNICEEVINNISRTDPNIAGAFYQSYYLSILQDIFFVLTDRDHKSGNI